MRHQTVFIVAFTLVGACAEGTAQTGASGQSQTVEAFFRQREEEWLRAITKALSDRGIVRVDGPGGVRGLNDVEEIVKRIASRLPQGRVLFYPADLARQPRRSAEVRVESVVEETNASRFLAVVSVKVERFDTLRLAEQRMAHIAAHVPGAFIRGAPDGKDVGEVSYYHAESRSAVIMSLRDNLVTRVHYSGLHRVAKSPRSRAESARERATKVILVPVVCTDLARAIDGDVLNLVHP